MKPLPRLDYDGEELDEKHLPPTPLHLVLRWYKEAVNRHDEYEDLLEPSALWLATTDANGQPSLRTVLLRFLDQEGPGFVSRLGSRKADDVETNPQVAASLVWLPLFKQIHFRGIIERIDDGTLEEYWNTRPYGARITSIAMDQSRPIADRSALEARHHAAMDQYPVGSDVPRPADFAGWRIRCQEIEFWSGRDNRLHDRLLFTNRGGFNLGDPGWKVTRLMP